MFAGQVWHARAPAAAAEPGAHCIQGDARPGLYEPAAQVVQEKPVLGEKEKPVPCAHEQKRASVLDVRADEPGHAVHDVEPAGANVFRVQDEHELAPAAE